MKKSLRKIIAAICMGTMLLSCTAYGADSSQNLMAYTDNVLSDGSLIYYFEEVAVTLPADWQGKIQIETTDNSATFYHKASHEKWQEKYGQEGGKLFTLSGAFIIDKISGQKAGYSDSIADYDYYVRTFGNLDCLKDSEKDPMYCVKKAVLQKNMPEVYQAVGTEDFLIEENRMMKKYLEKEGVKVTYHEAEGIHDWSFWNKYLPEAVEWLLK